MTCLMLTALAFSLHIRGEKVRRAPTALLGQQGRRFANGCPLVAASGAGSEQPAGERRAAASLVVLLFLSDPADFSLWFLQWRRKNTHTDTHNHTHKRTSTEHNSPDC